MPDIIAIAFSKGGVGKSTTTVELATCYAAAGEKTLIIDLDSQGHSAMLSGTRDSTPDSQSSAAIFYDRRSPSELAVETDFGYDIVSSTGLNERLSKYLVLENQREHILRGVLKRDAGLARYDKVIIDTSATLNVINENVFFACTDIIIPSPPKTMDVDELFTFITYIDGINELRDDYNLDPINIMGILFTMAQERTIVTQSYKEFVESQIKKTNIPLVPVMIPLSTVVEDAHNSYMPVVLAKRKSKVAVRYLEAFNHLTGHELTPLERISA